ncbi:hypothetical protein EG68_10752 [Paragonimus skrjabini miyazakii]|uniref:Uncharacterized protein n=1 Tax=Paragonimus skrjabini miyazakii TaxID=59628 RepID=A0A8S9YQB9_9TREM|nr:hypothetical protein EG68_10752 [Paragonimus skrjabini miyazakii]
MTTVLSVSGSLLQTVEWDSAVSEHLDGRWLSLTGVLIHEQRINKERKSQLPFSLPDWIRVFDGPDCIDPILYFQKGADLRTNISMRSTGNQMLLMMWSSHNATITSFVAKYETLYPLKLPPGNENRFTTGVDVQPQDVSSTENFTNKTSLQISSVCCFHIYCAVLFVHELFAYYNQRSVWYKLSRDGSISCIELHNRTSEE